MSSGHSGRFDLAAALAGGGVHVLCFADAETQGPDSLLATCAGLDEAERRLFCERINTEDATGCLWPIAKLSALPARFALAPLEDTEALRACLQRVFELNATLCKCPVLVLHLSASATSAQIARAAEQLQTEWGDASLVRELILI